MNAILLCSGTFLIGWGLPSLPAMLYWWLKRRKPSRRRREAQLQALHALRDAIAEMPEDVFRAALGITHEDMRVIFEKYRGEYASDGYTVWDFLDFVVVALADELAQPGVGIEHLTNVYKTRLQKLGVHDA